MKACFALAVAPLHAELCGRWTCTCCLGLNAGPPVCCCSETVRLIRRLHQFDVMRANKAPFAFGLEPRVPFLDKAFLETSMGIDPADKMVRLRRCFE